MLKILKIAITIMTTLIIVGLGVIFYKLGSSLSSDKPESTALYIPANVQIINAFSQGRDIGLLVRDGNDQKILMYKQSENKPSRELIITREEKAN